MENKNVCGLVLLCKGKETEVAIVERSFMSRCGGSVIGFKGMDLL